MIHVSLCFGVSNHSIFILRSYEANIEISTGAKASPGTGQDNHFDPRVNVDELVYPLQIFPHSVCKRIMFFWSVESNQDYGGRGGRGFWHMGHFDMVQGKGGVRFWHFQRWTRCSRHSEGRPTKEVKEDGGTEGPVLGKSALQYLREAHASFCSRLMLVSVIESAILGSTLIELDRG